MKTPYRLALLEAYGQLTALLREGESVTQEAHTAILATFDMLEASVAKAKALAADFAA